MDSQPTTGRPRGPTPEIVETPPRRLRSIPSSGRAGRRRLAAGCYTTLLLTVAGLVATAVAWFVNNQTGEPTVRTRVSSHVLAALLFLGGLGVLEREATRLWGSHSLWWTFANTIRVLTCGLIPIAWLVGLGTPHAGAVTDVALAAVLAVAVLTILLERPEWLSWQGILLMVGLTSIVLVAVLFVASMVALVVLFFGVTVLVVIGLVVRAFRG